MSERFKYAINGVYKCESFAEHLATGQFPRHSIVNVQSISDMHITLKVREEDNQVYPYIAYAKKRKLKIRAFFKIKTKLWSLCHKTNESTYLEPGQGVSGPFINIQDVLNEKNGYLENGGLTVEYGFHVDAILGFGDIWIFNLDSKLFDCKKDNNTVSIRSQHGVYHSPKPLLVFHSPLLLLEPKDYILLYENGFYVQQFLQFANGVRIPTFVLSYEWLKIAEIGRRMKMMNVVHYCDNIIRTIPDVFKDEEYLKGAIKLNMKQCVRRMLGIWDNKDLIEELRTYLDEIPGEMMKVLVARLLKDELIDSLD